MQLALPALEGNALPSVCSHSFHRQLLFRSLLPQVELLRLSRRGPDALMSGVSQCGAGFVNERTTGCGDISYAEFV